MITHYLNLATTIYQSSNITPKSNPTQLKQNISQMFQLVREFLSS